MPSSVSRIHINPDTFYFTLPFSVSTLYCCVFMSKRWNCFCFKDESLAEHTLGLSQKIERQKSKHSWKNSSNWHQRSLRSVNLWDLFHDMCNANDKQTSVLLFQVLQFSILCPLIVLLLQVNADTLLHFSGYQFYHYVGLFAVCVLALHCNAMRYFPNLHLFSFIVGWFACY